MKTTCVRTHIKICLGPTVLVVFCIGLYCSCCYSVDVVLYIRGNRADCGYLVHIISHKMLQHRRLKSMGKMIGWVNTTACSEMVIVASVWKGRY